MTKVKTIHETRVLVIDDDVSTTMLLQKVIANEGYHVETANSAEEALLLDSKGKFHVVLADIMMPDKDGIELLVDLKKQDPTCQVVMMTAGGTATERAQSAMKLGAADFLLKPFDMEEVLLVIKLCASKRNRWRGVLRGQKHD